MTVVDVVVHVVVVAELLESFDELSAAEESELEELDLLVWNHLVCCAVEHQGRAWCCRVVNLAFS